MSRNAIKMICLEQKNLPLQIRLNMIVKKQVSFNSSYCDNMIYLMGLIQSNLKHYPRLSALKHKTDDETLQ